MASVRIYKPARSATQSGRNKSQAWLMVFLDPPLEYTDPLMGWTGSTSTQSQVKLWFDTQDAAIAYANSQKLNYVFKEDQSQNIVPKNYGDNFKPSKRG